MALIDWSAFGAMPTSAPWMVVSTCDCIAHVIPTGETHSHDDYEDHLGYSTCWCVPAVEPQVNGPMGLVGWVYTHNANDDRR